MVTMGVAERLKELEAAVKEGKYEEAQAMLPEIIRETEIVEKERNIFYARDICTRNPRGICPKLKGLKIGESTDNLAERIKSLEKQNEELRIDSFRSKMDLLIKTHPDYKEVPFGYFDKERDMIYTPAVAEIFGISDEKVVNYSNLKAIYESVKKGARLKNYEIRPGIFIYTYPLSYDRLPVGVAFVLNDSKRDIDEGKMFRFVRTVLREVKKISHDYRIQKRRL